MTGPAIRARAAIRTHELVEQQPQAFLRADDDSVPMVVVLASDPVPSAHLALERRMGGFGNVVIYDVDADDVISIIHARPTPDGQEDLAFEVGSSTTFGDLAAFVADGMVVTIQVDGSNAGLHAHLERASQLI